MRLAVLFVHEGLSNTCMVPTIRQLSVRPTMSLMSSSDGELGVVDMR